MKAEDWQDMETAPLNPYGKPWGPTVLIWYSAEPGPVAARFDPWFGWESRDCGPAWVTNGGNNGDADALDPDYVAAWMPITPPEGVG